jgi:hypothetical protein
MMLQQSETRAAVYQVLDQVLADRTVSAPSRGAIFSVIDSLRQRSAAAEELRRAETIALEMHKLEWALRRGDIAASDAAISELQMLAVSWLDSSICGSN